MKPYLKKLPNGWAFLVSIRQIKDLIRQTGADVRVVEFKGTAHKPREFPQGSYKGVNIDARVDGGRWCYRFRFSGLPEKALPPDRAGLSELILADITDFISRPPVQTLDTTTKPEHRIMFFRFADGNLTPNFSTQKQDFMDDSIEMYERNRWWEN